MASNTFYIGVCVCVCEREREKWNFVDKHGNHTEMVEVLCVRHIAGNIELMLIHVVVG